MTAKNSLWRGRIEQAIRNQYQVIGARLMAEMEGLELDESEREQRFNEATEQAVLGQAPFELSLAKAHAACDALRGPCHADSPLEPAQQVALEYLAALTGVSAVQRHRATVQASFSSSSLTYQGDFERFKELLRMGVSSQAPDSFSCRADMPQVRQVKVLERSYELLDSEGSFLKTCRLKAELEFELVVMTAEPEVDFLAIAADCRAVLGDVNQSIPTQRLNLSNVVLVSTSVD